MNFINQIKHAIEEQRFSHGPRGKTLVPTRALVELINDHAKMDSILRIEHIKDDNNCSPQQLLVEALESVYRNNDRQTDAMMLIVLDTLKPLIVEKHKQEEMLQRERL
jgi:hypothetical protein